MNTKRFGKCGSEKRLVRMTRELKLCPMFKGKCAGKLCEWWRPNYHATDPDSGCCIVHYLIPPITEA